MSYKYAYLIGISFWALLWLVMFLLRKDLRKEILFMSLVAGPVAPIAQILWFYEDYWRPEYTFPIELAGVLIGIEEYLFAFFMGGVACVSYEVIFQKKAQYGPRRTKDTFIILLITLLCASFFKYILNLNSIWATTLPMFISSLIMIFWDKDLVPDLLLSGLSMAIITLFLYWILIQIYPLIFSKFWLDGVFTGINIINIPIEELLWFIITGAFTGILYEFWTNVERYWSIKK
jgi:hypothetical protein